MVAYQRRPGQSPRLRPDTPEERLKGEEAAHLCRLMDEMNAAVVKLKPFDFGWFDGWVGYAPRNPYADGSAEEREWSQGYRQGRRDREADDALGNME